MTAPDDARRVDDVLSPKIARRADTMGGSYCIAGTRMRVWTIKNFWRGGMGVDAICSAYPGITPDQVNAALDFGRYGRPRFNSDVQR